jgi:hypothetical protein
VKGVLAATVADTWLHGVLNGDVTLDALILGGVWGEKFPDEEPLPAVLFTLQDDPLIARGLGRNAGYMTSMTYVVRGVARIQDYGPPLTDIASRIDSLLEDGEGVVAGGQVLRSQRLREFRMIEEVAGEGGPEIRHLGGFYRVVVSQ